MKQTKKILAIIVTLVLSISMIPSTSVSAAKKVKLNKTRVTIYVGKTVTLKLKNNKKKIKWSSSNKKVATVSSKGKVKGKKAGKVTITAKVGKKKYKCKITVKKENKNNNVVVTVKEKIKKACITHGKNSSNMSGTYYYLDRATVSDYMPQLEYYTSVKYFPSQDIIRIDVLTENTDLSQDWMTTFDIVNINDATCKVWYSDSFDNYGEGVVYKKLIHQNNAVDFSYTDMVDDVITICEDVTSDIRIGLLDFDYLMGVYSVGVSAYDLGFTTLYSRYTD